MHLKNVIDETWQFDVLKTNEQYDGKHRHQKQSTRTHTQRRSYGRMKSSKSFCYTNYNNKWIWIEMCDL